MSWTLVTGGAKHLGADLCYTLAQAGYNVVVHYNKSKTDAEKVAKKCQSFGVQAEIIQGDFSNQESLHTFIKNYLERFEQTQNFISNVGNFLIKSSLQTEINEWEELFQINLHAPFAIIKALSPSIIHHQGQIITIGVAGLTGHRANTYSTAYYLTKQSLYGLTKSLAKELAPQEVRVNMISPGFLAHSVDLADEIKKIPMKRPAKNEEICRVLTFLLDPKSSYITGQNIEIAGGFGL